MNGLLIILSFFMVNDDSETNESKEMTTSTSTTSTATSSTFKTTSTSQSTALTKATSTKTVITLGSTTTRMITRSRSFASSKRPLPKVALRGRPCVTTTAVTTAREIDIIDKIKDEPELRLPEYNGTFDFFRNAVKPENCPQYTMEQVKVRKAIDTTVRQEAVVKRLKDRPFLWGCAYCDFTIDSLYYASRHVAGIRFQNKNSNRWYLRISCRKRIVEDGLNLIYKSIKRMPLNCPYPKKWYWVDVVCNDTSLTDEHGKFEIPQQMQNEADAFFAKFA